ARRAEFLQRVQELKETAEAPVGLSGAAAQQARPLPKPGVPLAEDEVKAILRQWGVATPRSVVLPGGCLMGELPLAFPLVVKARGADLLHKTEQRGVALNIRTPEDLRTTVAEMNLRFPGYDLLAEEMEPPGVEIIVGLIDDPTFGLSIMCGIGGVLAELYQDVSFRRTPITRPDADSMLRELKAHALFEGFRGIKASREAVIDLLLKVAAFGHELRGGIEQMDLNPVIVHGDYAVAVDAKLIWKSNESE
ncbi:MAG: acetate--CoA ligase family protein, partial [Firmicutes bacterium]|nr:acetate--CoA ligase family protein [Bacillota bacterium]